MELDGVTIVTDFPRKVREIENTWIPLPDGTKLAARIWLPEDAEADPVPAILEYLPYRKRDGTRERDELTHPYFAGHGYAGVRVDMRGSGDSEGVCLGEYLLQEQDDCLAVIEWLAAQPWCSGAVGMIGISWGGFNGLQVAARRPPALKAVISLCSTDDRYADDIHFMGGAVLTDKLGWGATAFAIANTPPDPALVGERWREMWVERLENNGLWLMDWFRHQRRDDFYRHGSICEDYADVEIPVYAVGGWADGYSNAIFRLLQNLSGPRKGLVGPWGHKYPHFARPGPRIGFLQECLRWWDQHLKGLDTGIMEEPMLRAWMQDPMPPAPWYKTRPGRWVAEPDWPAPGVDTQTWTLAPGALVREKVPERPLAIRSPETVGLAAGAWCGYGLEPDLPVDQRQEAGGSLVFETEPLAEDLEVLGFPVLEAVVSSDRPVATLAAVLSAVAPDGPVSRVSFGILNLTHRDSHAEPAPLVPGQAVTVSLKLNACGQRFAKGERIRLALSTAYWPIIWPAPEPVTLTVTSGASRLHLPLRAPQAADAALPDFAAPECATPMAQTALAPGCFAREVTADQASGKTVYTRVGDDGSVHHTQTDLTVTVSNTDRFTIVDGDPASATGRCTWRKRYQRGDWTAEVTVAVEVSAQADAFEVTTSLGARDGQAEVLTRSWKERIPRDLC
ncbi:CocE/NonD family hydrolase [Pelagibius sp.]|uniref:CocE/NonD family hydrolase n=1 Tax=Pelagibius sp. TaxID=1931238 RepID=UPI0026397D3E|nr:CocE/NonD family hydrolase [Pelagibius sp.]